MSSGIQQKYIVVTCNYVAREMGVTKLMSVADAKEKCPQLVLVKGEDLTHYREMSYKVTGKPVDETVFSMLAMLNTTFTLSSLSLPLDLGTE